MAEVYRNDKALLENLNFWHFLRFYFQQLKIEKMGCGQCDQIRRNFATLAQF